jgi:nucleoside-diphosphate-sugar epimerase
MGHNAKQDAYIVTGSEGFIGSNLVELLESQNIKCLTVDLAVDLAGRLCQ